MTDLRTKVAAVLDKHPHLNRQGMFADARDWARYQRLMNFEESNALSRADMLGTTGKNPGFAEVERAARWIESLEPHRIKRGTWHLSYELKHRAEGTQYVANGSFIAAALAHGLKWRWQVHRQPSGPNIDILMPFTRRSLEPARG